MPELHDVDTPEIIALRKAIRAALLAGEDWKSIRDITATEDELLIQERKAAGVPPPAGFREQYAAYIAEQEGTTDGI